MLLAATPVGYYLVNDWLYHRELEAIYRELDADDPNWRLADLIAAMPAPPPDEQNAAVQLLRVRDLLVKTPFTMPVPLKKTRTVPGSRNARLPADQVTAIRAALARLGPTVLEEARKLKDLPDGRFRLEFDENPFDDAKPSDIDGRLLPGMRLLQHDVMLRAHDGEIEVATESCQALLHAARALNDHPTLTAQVIRLAGQDLGVDAIERMLGQGAISEPRLAGLQHALEREANHDGLYAAMRGERAWCQQLYVLVEEGKISYSQVYGPAHPNSHLPKLFDMFPNLLLRGHAEQLRLSNEQVKASKLPEEARVAAFQAVQQEALDHPYVLDQGSAYVAGQVAEFQNGRARLRCAVTALAAERYRLAQGRWPQRADELVKAGLLKEALNDPFTGESLGWKQTPTGVVIYSRGCANIGFELWQPELRGSPAPRER